MTSPGGGRGKLIARGFVEVRLKDETRREMTELLARLRSQASKVKVPVTVDGPQFRRELAALARTLRPVEVPVSVSRAQFRRELTAATAGLRPVQVPVSVSAAQFRRELTAATAGLRPVRVPVTVSRAQFRRELLAATVGMRPITVPVRFAATGGFPTPPSGTGAGAGSSSGVGPAGTAAVNNHTRAVTALGRAYRGLPGKAYLPYGAKLVQESAAITQVRDQLYELRRAARIVPKYEARTVIDEMGRAHTRYVKISSQQGTFLGEVMSKTMLKSFATTMRYPGLFGPILAGAGAFFNSLSILAVPAVFTSWGVAAQASNAVVSNAFTATQNTINNGVRAYSATLIPHLISSAARVGATFTRLGPQIGTVFERTGPQVDTFTTGLVKLAENAMPGVVRASQAATKVTKGLADGMAEAGTGVTRFLTEVSSADDEASQSLRTFGVVASDVSGLAGALLADLTRVFGGQIWNEAESLFDNLTGTLEGFVGGALPQLGHGLEFATGAASTALGVLRPFSGLIGTWVGVFLGGAVAVRGLSSALGLLSAGMHLVTGAPAAMKGALNKFTQQVANAGISTATWTTKLTGSAAAGNVVAGATGKLVTGLQKLGSALPLVGAGLVAVAIAYDEVSSKAESSAQSVLAGSISYQQAVNDERNQIEKNNIQILGGISAKEEDALARKNVTEQINAQLAAMGPLERAQAEAALAQGKWSDAVRDFGPNSSQAASAAADLAAANDRLAAAQYAAEQAARSHTQAIVDQTNIMRGSVDAEFALKDAVSKTAEAQKEAEKAVKEHGASSQEAKDAAFELAKAQDAQADAAARAAEAAYAGLDPQTRASKAAEAYRTELLRTADVSSGPGRAAFEQIAGSMNDAELAMLSATAQASGLRTEIVTLPDGRTVTIVTETDRSKLDQLNDDFRNLDGKVATVTINGETMPVMEALAQVQAAIAAGTGTVTINGNPVPVRDVLTQVLAQTDSAHGTMTIDGDPTMADGKITSAVKFADGSTGTITVDGQPDPATGKINATVKYGNGQTSTIQVGANTASANSSLQGLVSKWQGYTIRMNGVVSSRIGGLAGGGVMGYAGGGISRFAGGGTSNRTVARPSRSRGMVNPGYGPGVDNVPTALTSPGESVLVPELTRLLGAKRILAANAEASGGRPATVVGQVASLMDGLIGPSATAAASPTPIPPQVAAAVQQPRQVAQQAAAAQPAVINVGSVQVKLEGSVDFSDPSFPRQFVVKLEEALRDLGRSRK